MSRLIVLAIVAMCAIPVLASSQDQTPSSGQLEASGRGSVILNGRLVMFGQIVGRRSRIVVRDRTHRKRRPGDAVVTLNGEELEFNRRGRLNVRGKEGRFFVQGSRVQVKIVATQLSFSTAGRGHARLRGRGFYRLNDERTQRWSRRTVRIEPSFSSTRRRQNNEIPGTHRSDRAGSDAGSSAGPQRGEAARG
ncbi:MAG: hypothetical protein ACR2N6_01530 [Miltoncostaeaceae bacterium]